MKKVFFAIAICFAVVSSFGQISLNDFGQVSFNDSEVANTINRSKKLNPQIINQNLIYPKQALKYQLLDGYVYCLEAEPGDNQTKLIKSKVREMYNNKNNMTNSTPMMFVDKANLKSQVTKK